MSKYLAFDLGAESGRAVVGRLDGSRLHLEVVHRFPNGAVPVLNSLYWDVLHLWTEMQQGLRQAVAGHGDGLTGIGVDTWGVDFCLLAADGSLLGNPYHYRDGRTDGIMQQAFQIVPQGEIYALTGVQFMQLNSLYQLLAMVQADSPALQVAVTFLHMPDLFNFWLCGERACEFTTATTSQCYDPRRRMWASDMLDRMGIPTRIFGEIVPPGTVLARLRPALAAEMGSHAIPIVATAGHDTASAVAAVPATGDNYLYISSGTWSLMGVEIREPIINEQSLAYNITNEGGVDGTFRFLRNIMGLWLVQECRREWATEGQSLSYGELTELATGAPALKSLVPLEGSRFLPPGDMPTRIQAFCRESGQPVPETKGQIVRCALESLALEYRWVAERLEEMVGCHLPTIHIVGGGSQNRLLNQFTADAASRQVVAGPVEATAAGNILVQAIALGDLSGLSEGRELIRRSFPLTTFEPSRNPAWDEAYDRYFRLTDRGSHP
ncbi:rhamnulokinase family protein [Chloroflexota bacterium]